MPQLYDPANPPTTAEEEAEDDAEDSQTAAFQRSLLRGGEDGKEGEEAVGLPRGGGGFRGFAFVVLKDREEVERVLKEWGRENEVEAELTKEEDVEMQEDGLKGKGKKVELSDQEKCRKAGMKLMT